MSSKNISHFARVTVNVIVSPVRGGVTVRVIVQYDLSSLPDTDVHTATEWG